MTALSALKSNWESLAESDALWAILTDESKIGSKWEVADFMATGEVEITTVMDYLMCIDCLPRFEGDALDFGCGVGRLTQPLARKFTSCVGLDISHQMIQRANSLNHFEHCRYVAHSETRLPFPDARFAFNYSNIVLQHMPRGVAEKYLRELVRVLEPYGVLVFGVQDSFAIRNASSLLLRLRQKLRIRSRIKRLFAIGTPDMQMHCFSESAVRPALGTATVVDIQITNTAQKDFNGRLRYFPATPTSGFVAKQYCVTKAR
jgi:SAM-dependent methyltransferase